MRRRCVGWLCIGVLMVGCASPAVRPTVTVFKGADKTFADYQADDEACRRYAQEGTKDAQRSDTTAMRSAAPAVLGVGGSVIGQATGLPTVGAIAGAGGAVAGSVLAAQARTGQPGTLQQEVNTLYSVCMDAQGHRVPGSAPLSGR